MTDTVRNQGLALREMEKALAAKSSKSEISTALNMKANSSDISRSLSEMNNAIDQRVTMEEIRSLLNEKISKSELIYMLNAKASNEDVHNMIDEKVDSSEYTNEINELKKKIEFLEKELNKKTSGFVEYSEIKTFKNLIEQKANFTDMNEALNTKANKETVLTSLKTKANKSDVDILLNNKVDKSEFIQIANALQNKCDISEIDNINRTLSNYVNKENFDSIIESINNKAEANDFKLISDAFQEMKTSMTKRIDDIDQDLDRLIENIKTQFQNLNVVINNIENNKIDYSSFEKVNQLINKKVDADKIEVLITKVKNEMFETISSFKGEVSTSRKKNEDKNSERLIALTNEIKELMNEVNVEKEKINKFLVEKNIEKDNMQIQAKNLIASSLTKVHDEIFGLKESINNISMTFSNELKNKIDTQNFSDVIVKINEDLSSKVSIPILDQVSKSIENDINDKVFAALNEIKLDLSKKISLNEISALLTDKAEKKALDCKVNMSDFDKLKNQIDTLIKELNSKVSNDKFELSNKNIISSIEDISTSLTLKANIREILTLLKNKAEVDDVNNALNEIHNELDTKNTIDSFSTAMDNQAIINDALCTENCLARWLWKSGKVKNGYAIPWEVQAVNTAPDNFIWEKDKTFILCSSAGLYKVEIGFFSDKKPAVQILVNGEVVISSITNSNFVTRGKKGVNGNCSGVTLTDFLLLGDKSRISISYSGDEGAIGFLGLKKM